MIDGHISRMADFAFKATDNQGTASLTLSQWSSQTSLLRRMEDANARPFVTECPYRLSRSVHQHRAFCLA